jgi:hypothetical protein
MTSATMQPWQTSFQSSQLTPRMSFSGVGIGNEILCSLLLDFFFFFSFFSHTLYPSIFVPLISSFTELRVAQREPSALVSITTVALFKRYHVAKPFSTLYFLFISSYSGGVISAPIYNGAVATPPVRRYDDR